MSDMRVSIIIPTYNRSRELARALRSTQSETGEGIEIIVVDDASTEDIAGCVARLGLPNCRVVRRERNGGAAAARNTAVAKSKAEFVAFLDSDDEWLPGKLAAQIRFLEAHPEVSLVCTGHEIRRPGRAVELRRFASDLLGTADLAFGCSLSPGSTVCVRRCFFERVGPFDESMPRLEDWDWLLRATDHSKIGTVAEELAVVHAGAWPAQGSVESAISTMLRKHEERLRRAGPRAFRHFLAALHYERAVASYRSGRRLAAARYYLRSLAAYPFRPLGHFILVARATFALFGRGASRG